MSEEDRSGQSLEERPGSDPLRRLTDIANARRFVEHHGTVLRWVLSEKSWLLWDSRRWRCAAVEEVEALAKLTASTIWDEVTSAQGSDERIDIARHAKQSESARAVAAMVRLARSDERIWVRRSDLDSDPYLFNCLNGTIDLQTGALRPHDPADHITKLAAVQYERRATYPTWLTFLRRVMDGNANLMRFLQEAVGYSLSGDVSEQCFFFLYGLGANGKSTFVETIRALLGDYARHADSTTFLVQRAELRPDVARLSGARFVSAAEIPQGGAMDQTLMKQLTGGGIVTARPLYSAPVEFATQAKIWIEGNHKPDIGGVDHAMWRRIVLIPFNVTIPVAERDPDLWNKLHRELPGILNWALAGFRAWRGHGLRSPAEVLAAVADYKAESDPLTDFVAECCILGSEFTIWKDELYRWYEWWCGRRRTEHLSKKAFGTSIAERGTRDERTRDGRYWVGIGVRPDLSGDT